MWGCCFRFKNGKECTKNNAFAVRGRTLIPLVNQDDPLSEDKNWRGIAYCPKHLVDMIRRSVKK